MCGIAGTNGLSYDIDASLETMRRGNDGFSFLEIDNVRLAFQLHSITGSPQRSQQPFHSERQALLANGELFNFSGVAKTLSVPVAEDTTDIEVLHHFTEEKGIDAFSQLNTMVAGAVYDIRTKTLHLFRDWVGEMPLHYTYDAERKLWFFGSTMAAVIAGTREATQKIFEAKPGTITSFDERGVHEHTFFDITCTPDLEEEFPISVRRLKEFLEISAKERTWTKVPVCSLLSGGMDSMITTHLLLKHGEFDSPLPVYTFHCTDIPVDASTDLYHAQRSAEYFGEKVEHRIVSVTSKQIIDVIPDVIRSLEDTRGKDYNLFTGIYNRLLAEQISRDGIRLLYNGEGPDEALGSYTPWGSFQYPLEESTETVFRKKMVSNLHKGTLPRLSKIMMEFGPLECRSFFLDQRVMTLLSSLPGSVIRAGAHRKQILIDAFKDEIPIEFLVRQKARPQDATGITAVLQEYLQNNPIDSRKILEQHFERLRTDSASAAVGRCST